MMILLIRDTTSQKKVRKWDVTYMVHSRIQTRNNILFIFVCSKYTCTIYIFTLPDMCHPHEKHLCMCAVFYLLEKSAVVH